jgi:redox-sensitive bicupin YhaK (pirin superfamily)
VALPKFAEETPPEFHHYSAGELPTLDAEGVHLRVIAGSLLGLTSPVRTFSSMGYGVLELATDARCVVRPEHEESAVYLVDGDLKIDGERLPDGALATLLPGRHAELEASSPTRCMVLGGEPADGPRHIWWNFVSSSPERLERAKQDWKLGRFAPVPGETEFIPLPES